MLELQFYTELIQWLEETAELQVWIVLQGEGRARGK